MNSPDSECFGRHQFDHELLQAEDSGLATSGDVHSCDLDYQELDFPGFVQQESPQSKKPKVFVEHTPKVTKIILFFYPKKYI